MGLNVRAYQRDCFRLPLLAAFAWLCFDAPLLQAVAPAEPHASAHVSVLTADQIVQLLDETVAWYRTLGTQQQNATEPSDLLILYANRQTADKVIGLAFEIARANAELLSSEASSAGDSGTTASSAETLDERQKRAEERRRSIQTEMDSTRHSIATAIGRRKVELQAKLAELQGELDMVNAQKNLLDTTASFVGENDARRASVSVLKTHIEAIAASIPAASLAGEAQSATQTPTSTAGVVAGATIARPSVTASPGSSGIWDLLSEAIRLSQKASTIAAIDRNTASLERTFTKMRTAPFEQLNALSARGDSLAKFADTADGVELKRARDQFDTLAWQFAQTSAIFLPLNKVSVLLEQYRHNLNNWRTGVRSQYRETLTALAVRIGILLALLAIVFAGAELWRRAVVRYTFEPVRRYRLLLLRKIVVWTVVLAILGLTLVTRLSSFATFAGLITAGVAVAMQSVLVSVVGYFFLIGKYGVRVGDRVQIGNVVGEVIDLGLVRMHLLELSSQGPTGPTGRVVAFANSIVFQASGGLFKQIPGVDLAWHETTLNLPAGCDYAAVKAQLLASLTAVLGDYRTELTRQTREIQRTAAVPAESELSPQVQLQFSAAGVEAKARYPVHLYHAAEIDERVSRELLGVLTRCGAEVRKDAAPAESGER